VVMTDDPNEMLRTVYQETCKTHAAIADFRAKLLALLPIASGTGIFLLLGKLDGESRKLLLPIGVFGALVTFGLFMYELRGIEDCTVLRRRGKNIEEALAVRLPNSQYGFWPGGKLALVDEIGAAWIVYMTVLITWIFVAGAGVATLMGGWRERWEIVFGLGLGILYVVVLVLALSSVGWGHDYWGRRRRKEEDLKELRKVERGERELVEEFEIRPQARTVRGGRTR
jgi:hypothetical protein